MFDSKGKTYRQNGTLYVLPAAPPYGAQYQFKAGFVPLPSDVSSQGPDASVVVYAAPYDVESTTQCCSENSEANRIAAETYLSVSGVLTVTVTKPVPSGYQIAVILDFGALYRGRVSPAGGGACDLPSQSFCEYAATSGFAMRFYVGAVPNPSTSVPAGSCLLAYNTAFVDDGVDPCCYPQGGKNQCDPKVQCNERSGGGCCLIYGTEATQGGQRCCLYENGGPVDDPAECTQLLASP